jgi:ElaB/YqjD/DUF883 family membrane-anchored ribosome-binding protein
MTKSKESPSVTRLEDVFAEQAKNLESELRKSVDKSVDFVKANPLLALAAAFAVGFVVAKATQRKRS